MWLTAVMCGLVISPSISTHSGQFVEWNMIGGHYQLTVISQSRQCGGIVSSHVTFRPVFCCYSLKSTSRRAHNELKRDKPDAFSLPWNSILYRECYLILHNNIYPIAFNNISLVLILRYFLDCVWGCVSPGPSLDEITERKRLWYIETQIMTDRWIDEKRESEYVPCILCFVCSNDW